MPATVLIGNGTTISAGTVTINGVTDIDGPSAKRPVIDTTGLEDTVSTQDTGILSFADGTTVNGGCSTATFKMIVDYATSDGTFTLTMPKGGQTATGTYKVCEVTKKTQVNQKVSFSAKFMPTGSVTMY